MFKQDLPVVCCTVSPEEVARLKGLGCLWDKTTPDCFNVRVITGNGMISSEHSRVLAEAAERFGNGKMAMTTRLTVELQRIPYGSMDALMAFLKEHGMETGGTGKKVRPVVACKGTTCQYGLIDTASLSMEIHSRFYKGYRSVVLPHKFKIAVGGCPNNCVKPELNDVGIIGQRLVMQDPELCKGCKKCKIEEVCPMKVCSVAEGKLVVDAARCNNCGRCMGKCPFHVTDEFTPGYAVYVGGRWGKKTAAGQKLNKLFTTEEEVLQTVEKCILLFREQGMPGERFADTIARLGFENVQAQLLGDELLARKEQILL